jgi:hypothetical protein
MLRCRVVKKEKFKVVVMKKLPHLKLLRKQAVNM